jgi:hypothetical protein
MPSLDQHHPRVLDPLRPVADRHQSQSSQPPNKKKTGLVLVLGYGLGGDFRSTARQRSVVVAVIAVRMMKPLTDQSPGITSLAHGWSTGPVAALSGYVLGLRPTSPGSATWTVEPQPGDLRFAQGSAATPRGPLISRWVRGVHDRTFRFTVIAPVGTRGTVAVPQLGRPRTIARDGEIVWRAGHAVGGSKAGLNGYDEVVFPAGPGSHTYAWG